MGERTITADKVIYKNISSEAVVSMRTYITIIGECYPLCGFFLGNVQGKIFLQ